MFRKEDKRSLHDLIGFLIVYIWPLVSLYLYLQRYQDMAGVLCGRGNCSYVPTQIMVGLTILGVFSNLN